MMYTYKCVLFNPFIHQYAFRLFNEQGPISSEFRYVTTNETFNVGDFYFVNQIPFQ